MNPNFTEKQRQYIAIWAEPPYKAQAAIARIIGVTQTTVSDWKQDPEFVRACDQARRDRRDAYLARERDELAKSLPRARRTMVANLTSESAAVSHQAAQWILEHFYGKAVAHTEISGPGGGPVQTESVANLDGLTDDELDILERIAARLGPAPSGASEA